MSAALASPVTVLVVDDGVVQRLVIERALADAGYAVLTASDAKQGLAVAERHRPDVILSDYYMPGLDGLAFCRAVRARAALAGTMFILHTFHAPPDVQGEPEGLDTVPDDYLVKPLKVEELRSKVRTLVRMKSLHAELRRERAELARLSAQLDHGFSGVLTLVNHLIGHRVPDALQRGERAAHLARWIGTRVQMDDMELRGMELAARIHEIGKLDLPDALLTRPPAQLTPAERERLGQFPLIGALLVERIPQLAPVAPLIRHQLENYDGTGTPDHLQGSQIPVGARVLRLVNLLEQAHAEGHRAAALVRFVEQAEGTVLGPRLARLAIEYVESASDSEWQSGKRQVKIDELQPGMTIALDLCTGRGTKLLPKNSKLTPAMIARIKSFQEFDPIVDEVYVVETPAGR